MSTTRAASTAPDFVFELPGNLDERIQIAVTDKHQTNDTLTPGHQTKRIYMGVGASGEPVPEQVRSCPQ